MWIIEIMNQFIKICILPLSLQGTIHGCDMLIIYVWTKGRYWLLHDHQGYTEGEAGNIFREGRGDYLTERFTLIQRRSEI